jgi:hypothetical protein
MCDDFFPWRICPKILARRSPTNSSQLFVFCQTSHSRIRLSHKSRSFQSQLFYATNSSYHNHVIWNIDVWRSSILASRPLPTSYKIHIYINTLSYWKWMGRRIFTEYIICIGFDDWEYLRGFMLPNWICNTIFYCWMLVFKRC